MNTFLDYVIQTTLKKAERAADTGEVPVAAAVFNSDKNIIVSLCSNLTKTHADPTAHAEMLAIREACRQTNSLYLSPFDIYVTLEPCPMCAAAIGFARFRRLYFGAYDVKSGGVDNGAKIYDAPSCHYAPEVYGGVGETKAAELLKKFFKTLRSENA